MVNKNIKIIGANQNNLNNITVDIEKNTFTTVTGVSGSGKSSLIFDVLFAEGQKKFMEINDSSMSYMDAGMTKADVESIQNLNPVVALEQRRAFNNPRSTVGTMTGIYGMLRSLYAMHGASSCLECGHLLNQITVSELVAQMLMLPQGYTVELSSPLVKERDISIVSAIEEAQEKQFTHLIIDNTLTPITDIDDYDSIENAQIEILVDRLSVDRDFYKQAVNSISITTATLNNPFCKITVKNSDGLEDENTRKFYKQLHCCQHKYVLMKLLPEDFAFNEAKAACRVCMGLGISYQANPEFMVVAPKKGLFQGALHKSLYNMVLESMYGAILYSLSIAYNFDLYTPYEELTPEIKDIIMYGTKGKKFKMLTPSGAKKPSRFENQVWTFKGFVSIIERENRDSVLRRSSGELPANKDIKPYMVECKCPVCDGTRLRKQYLEIKIFEKNIYQLCQMQLEKLLLFFTDQAKALNDSDKTKLILNEINRKIQVLCEIGLHYLDIDRKSFSLSGGELQRIKLSTQIGSDITNLIYIMDEPSIGLHAKDIQNLIKMIRRLSDYDNTVIIVEHSTDIIKSSDRVIEIGPGSGINGGNVVFNGSYEDLLVNENSITKPYLVDINKIKPNLKPRKPYHDAIKIFGARENNLKNIDVEIPLNQFVCITGVSGSGKSTLINSILVKRILMEKKRKPIAPGEHDQIEGIDLINNVIYIDQKVVSTSSNSTPATYMRIFKTIRDIYASIPECIEKGYTAQDFSLLSQTGLRCRHCSGKGVLTIEMRYMQDIISGCPVCTGLLYSAEGLQFIYRDKSIADVLKMSVDEAYHFFDKEKLLKKKLGFMRELGLGYLKLGQHTSSLSGGEAQRMNLSYELSKDRGKTNNLYLFDEPSNGLHPADVENLIKSINKLINSGNSVIVIEHDLDIIKTADYVIDLGPEGGEEGGYVVAAGSPFEVSRNSHSYTGQCLKQFFD